MFVGAVLCSSLFGAHIRSPSPEKNTAISDVLVGVSSVQSGLSASLGQNLLRDSNAYWDLVNKRGGIYGRKISILLNDDRYEPDPAVQNTNELIEQDKVFFLFDYVGTAALTRVLPLLTYYAKENIVNVAPFTGAEAQRRPPYDKFCVQYPRIASPRNEYLGPLPIRHPHERAVFSDGGLTGNETVR
jgi:ABC-type branched-subunit amino acid transport system substrate-binding protein